MRTWPLLRGVKNPHACATSEVQNFLWWRRELVPCETIAERLEEYMGRCITAVEQISWPILKKNACDLAH
jgi:hypothetical protein